MTTESIDDVMNAVKGLSLEMILLRNSLLGTSISTIAIKLKFGRNKSVKRIVCNLQTTKSHDQVDKIIGQFYLSKNITC